MFRNPFLKQLFICSGPWTLFFTDGMYTGLPTVLLAQLRRANQTISEEYGSWLPALHVYSAIPWVFILTSLITIIGRKRSHILVCTSALIGSISIYFSSSVTQILIASLFQGALTSSGLSTCTTIMTEYTTPKYRGILVAIKSASIFWGILVANTIGTFFPWQNIPLLAIICNVYTLLNVIIWPESPLWLMSKGKLDECADAHRWLKGKDEESERELNNLLKSHREPTRQKWSFHRLQKTIFQRQFIKPVLLANAMVCLHAFSGKLVCAVFALEVLKKISSNEATAYSGMLILDCTTVFSMYVGCFLSRFVRRRVMVIGFSSSGIIFLIIISVYLYLAKFDVVKESKYVSLTLLAGYSISISCGPLIMSSLVINELIPLECRSLSLCIISLLTFISYGTFYKIAPLCFKYLGMPGTFALFAISSITLLIVIYIYVPETKDKTLQEINDILLGTKRRNEEGTELLDLNTRKRLNFKRQE